MITGLGGPFVGRGQQKSLLLDLVGRTSGRSGPTAALLVGEAGAGKTRLVEQVLTEAAAPAPLRITGFVPEQGVPLASAAGLLHRLDRDDAPAPSTADHALDRFRLFESCHEALTRSPSRLLVCDDLQWVDEMSLALLRHLLSAAGADSLPLTLLCTSRPTSRAAEHLDALRRLLGPACHDVPLGPLDPVDALQLVHAVNPSLDPNEAAAVVGASGGLPFWIERLARAQYEPDAPDPSVEAWLRPLSGDAAGLLAALAVLGRPVHPDDAAAVLEWPPARIAVAATELLNTGLVVPLVGSLQVAHDLLREAARRLLPDRDAAALHRQVAGWLEREAEQEGPGSPLLLEALTHAQAGGLDATGLALRAARSPRRRLFGRAGLEQLAAVADASPGESPLGLELRAEVAQLAGEIGERRAAYERSLPLLDLLPAGEPRARAAVGTARYALGLNLSVDAARLLDRARSEAPELAWLQVEVDSLDAGRCAWLEHDTRTARAFMNRAMTAARELLRKQSGLDDASRGAYAEALRAQREISLMDDDLVTLAAASDERVEVTRGQGEEHLIAQAEAALPLWYLDRWAEAAVRLQSVLDASKAQVYPALTAELCHALAYTCYQLGELGRSHDLVVEATLLEERIGAPARRPVSWVRGSLSHLVRASTHDWAEALAALRSETDAETDPHARIRLRMWTATCAARFDGHGAAQEVLAQVARGDDDGAVAQCARCTSELRLQSVELYARVGELSRAADALAQWDAEHPAPLGRAAAQRRQAEAVLAGCYGRDDAVPLLEQARAHAHAAQLRLDEIRCAMDLGTVLAPLDRERATSTWAQALDLADQVGAQSEAGQLQRCLRGLGARGRRAATGSHGALSVREHEVAQLAAAGARNTDIASALFLSPKTVERHLTNAFTKLGVRNRAELATHLARQASSQ